MITQSAMGRRCGWKAAPGDRRRSTQNGEKEGGEKVSVWIGEEVGEKVSPEIGEEKGDEPESGEEEQGGGENVFVYSFGTRSALGTFQNGIL